MNEHCDGCGRQTPVLEIVFTGRRFLCENCVHLKDPSNGASTVAPRA